MTPKIYYETVTDAINKLRNKGFTTDFNLEENCIVCNLDKYKSDEFEIIEIYRYEGNTDPADEATVYGIQSKNGVKGILVAGYGISTDILTTKILTKLGKLELTKENKQINMNSNDKTDSQPFVFSEFIDYAPNSVVSKTIIKKSTGTITLFAFDKGEELSEHTAPFEALVQVIDGLVDIKVGANYYHLHSGESIILPAHVPHALKAIEKFKMILTMIKS